jgi:hypothetical protein
MKASKYWEKSGKTIENPAKTFKKRLLKIFAIFLQNYDRGKSFNRKDF